MSETLKILAENLRYYRREKGWTQICLSEKIGRHQSYISLIENSKVDVSLSVLGKLARVLSVKPDDLVKRRG